MKIHDLPIDKTWTLFLDRDGVINLHYPNDYVKNWDEFYFLEGVLDAFSSLSQVFTRVIVVTNQQGVGKKLMSKAELELIHAEMLREVRKHGGRIHAIYAAVDLAADDVHQMRKPNIGMALKAKKDFVEIDFSKSIMVGDTGSDMRFGKNAGMKTVFVGDDNKITAEEKLLVDFRFDSLKSFAETLGN